RRSGSSRRRNPAANGWTRATATTARRGAGSANSTGGSDAVTGRTLFDKIWESHVVARLGDGADLLHVDRHLLHDLGGPRAFEDLAGRALRVRNPELTFATADHAVSTAPGRSAESNATSR